MVLPGTSKAAAKGFTLIELLVVVAIIALLIAILLPSLSKARAQARTVQCATRISQLGKAILMYADDFDGYPPFMGKAADGEFGGGPRDANEHWIFTLPDDWTKDQYRDWFYCAREEDWPEEVEVPQSGYLFRYTRFEGLYLCPEFQRIRHPDKSQNVFNLTRMESGRRFRVPGTAGQPSTFWPGYTGEGGWDGDGVLATGDWEGPIVRVAAVYAPARMPMLADERWNRHVANPQNAPWHWLDTDPLLSNDDEQGQYHGVPVTDGHDPEAIPPIKRGSAFYYDGHVDLRRDPCPSGTDTERTYSLAAIPALIDMIRELLYAQRGMKAPI